MDILSPKGPNPHPVLFNSQAFVCSPLDDMLDGNNPASGGNVSTMRRPYTLPDSHDYPSADTFASLERDLAGQMYRPEYPDCSPQEGLEEPGRNSEWLTRQAGAAQYINFQSVHYTDISVFMRVSRRSLVSLTNGAARSRTHTQIWLVE